VWPWTLSYDLDLRTKPIVIIVWLVRCWTLPFLRACYRLDDSALDDRRLPDQCWVVLDPTQIQQSGARCDAVGPIDGSNPLAKGHAGPKYSRLWSVDGSAREMWLKNLRRVVLSAIVRLLLPARDSGTVFLSTSSLSRHSQHFVRNWKLIYLFRQSYPPRHCFFNCFAIVVLEVSFT